MPLKMAVGATTHTKQKKRGSCGMPPPPDATCPDAAVIFTNYPRMHITCSNWLSGGVSDDSFR